VAGIVQPTLEQAQPSCWVIRAAGSLKSGPALAPGSDPESASSFLRGASSWRSGHPVCGPWRSAAMNWRWPCPPRRTQQTRTPGRLARSKLHHAKSLVRFNSVFLATRRATPAYAPIMSHPENYLPRPVLLIETDSIPPIGPMRVIPPPWSGAC
jgi:hypothetical protein